MNPNDVIETYVLDVMRRLPRADRNDIGLELRDLLAEMLADRAGTAGKPPDDAMVLAMLREFGTPAEVAARYRPPGMVIIPAEQTRMFTLLALGGTGLQWALTLPRVFAGQPLSEWWWTWGLGALWWPGYLVLMALAVAWLHRVGWFTPVWRPRVADRDRIHRGATAFGLGGLAIGIAFMISLPWLVTLLPAPLPHVFAFDAGFLHGRAWPVVFLWLDNFLVRLLVFSKGRWTSRLRRVDLVTSVFWLALLAWWLLAGDIFRTPEVDAGARAGIVLVILIVVFDLAAKLYHRRARIRPPRIAG